MTREKEQSMLTEWDFDIPSDNRFHDPFTWQDTDVKAGTTASDSKNCNQKSSPKDK